jgi:release factor glutamine methyltransferase
MKVPTNLLKDAVNHYINELSPVYGDREAPQMLYQLTEFFFGMDRLKMAMNKDFRLSESEMLKLHFAVKELKKFKPLQYVTERAWFCGNWLKVGPEVLIPRPETEQMVGMATNLINGLKSPIRIIDLGTGSGCIAISIKQAFPHAEVHALDISAAALNIARENARVLSLEIHFHQLDMGRANTAFQEIDFDLVISNPPYVIQSEKAVMQKNVLDWEPEIALFAPENDALFYFRHIAKFAQHKLKTDGACLVELNEGLGKQTATLFGNLGFTTKLANDIHGKNRFLLATKIP